MRFDIALRRIGNYSPLRYPGGKATLAPFIGNLLKKNGLFKGTYVEPFAGGAGAGISLLLSEQVNRIVINDLDPAIYAFWTSVLYKTEKLVKLIKGAKLNVAEWRRQRDIYKAADPTDALKLGFSTFFLNRVNRSGIIEGWPIGGLDQTGKWKIDARFNKDGLIDRVRNIGLYRDRIEVANMDALKLIKSYMKKSQTFIYLDPPYCVKGGSLYLNSYKEKDHASLAAFLNTHPNTPWILTYDNVSQIKQLYPQRTVHEFSLRYSASKKMLGSELLILSDEVAKSFDD